MSLHTNPIEKYERVEKIGEGRRHQLSYNNPYSALSFSGTYGTVYKAREKANGDIVALKVVRLDEDDEVSRDHIRYLSNRYHADCRVCPVQR